MPLSFYAFSPFRYPFISFRKTNTLHGMRKKKFIGWGLMLTGGALMILGNIIPSVLAGILMYVGALIVVGIGMAVTFS